jgi:hypothetical protein
MTTTLTRSRTAVLAAAAGLALALSAAPAPASAMTAPPEGVQIEIVAVNGNGCPAGTTTIDRWPDGKTVRVVYSAFTAEAGAGAPPTAFRKWCGISVSVDPPPGMTYGFNGVYSGGWAILPDGSSGTVRNTVYFQGHTETDEYVHPVAGPLVGDWETEDHAAPDTVVWAACGEKRNINIGIELRVNARPGGEKSTLLTDATAFDAEHDLYWRPCP